MKRVVENSAWDARHRAEIHLDTGRLITLFTEWKPSHWDEVSYQRDNLARAARKKAAEIREQYGLGTSEIKIVKESRQVVKVTETTTSEKFHSTIYPEGTSCD